jgi:hypothetical protein
LYKDVLIIAPGPVHAAMLDRRAIVLRLEPFDQLLTLPRLACAALPEQAPRSPSPIRQKLSLLVSKPAKNRRGFIGSSVARIIMGTDEAALVRGEKSGVAVR